MEFEINFYLVAAAMVVLTGISKSGFGAGLEILAVPVLSIFVLPFTAAAIMLPILVMIDLANLWRYRESWNRQLVFSILPVTVIGIAAGAAAFQNLDPNWLKLGIGGLALAFLLQSLVNFFGGGNPKKFNPVLRNFLAALGGLTSFVAHAGGPPLKIVLLSENLPKREFVGTNSYLFAGINFLKLFPYFYLGQLSAENLTFSLSLFPFVLLGIVLGFSLNGAISQVWFNRVVLSGLFVVGVKLIFDGATGLF